MMRKILFSALVVVAVLSAAAKEISYVEVPVIYDGVKSGKYLVTAAMYDVNDSTKIDFAPESTMVNTNKSVFFSVTDEQPKKFLAKVYLKTESGEICKDFEPAWVTVDVSNAKPKEPMTVPTLLIKKKQ